MLSRRIYVALLGALAVPLALVSLAWACAPQGTIRAEPGSGPAGTVVTVFLSGFPVDEPIDLRWNGFTGPVLASGTGPSFSAKITVPATAPAGFNTVNAMGQGEHAEHTRTAGRFDVTAPVITPPPAPPAEQPPSAAAPAVVNPFTPVATPAAPAPVATPAATAPRLAKLGSAVFYTSTARKQYTLLRALSVRPARSGSTVRVSCSGKACPFGTKTRKVTQNASRLDLVSLVRGKRLRPGNKLEIRVTKAGNMGVVQRLTIRGGRGPKSEKLCFAPGAAKPAACSA